MPTPPTTLAHTRSSAPPAARPGRSDLDPAVGFALGLLLCLPFWVLVGVLA